MRHFVIDDPIDFRVVPVIVFSLAGLILGFLIDETTLALQRSKTFGNGIAPYVAIESAMIFFVSVLMIKVSPSFVYEWQNTLHGLVFVSFFWGLLPTYFENLRALLRSVVHQVFALY